MSWFVALDPVFTIWDFVLPLLFIVISLAQIITAIVFIFGDLRKNKMDIGLLAYWALLFITVLVAMKDPYSVFWLTARLVFALITFFYFFGYLAFRIVRRKKERNKL